MDFPTKANTLVIDLNPVSGLGPLLRDILDTAENLHVHSYVDLSENSGPDELARRLSILNSQNHSDLIFLTMPSDFTVVPEALVKIQKQGIFFPPIIAVFQDMKSEQAIDLLKAGIVDFITPPFKPIDILPCIWRLLRRMATDDGLLNILMEKIGLQQIIGKSATFLAEIEKIPIIAKSNSTVLISGETGTGKELCTRAIHYLSMRSGFPFVPVNCGAIPVDLVENELFGHRKGAYTGAHESQTGLIREADGGTIFLDEIESLPLSAQVKLLRFLQDKEYRQLGSAKMIRSDVRVIAATNISLDVAVKDGAFRRDLYYRLNVIPLALPPLRERKEDIPLLARHFLKKQAVEAGRDIAVFSAGALRKLMLYDWPGNVRELENVIERAVVFSGESCLIPDDIVMPDSCNDMDMDSFRDAKAKVVERFEREYIHSLLLAHQGNISKASKTAGKNRRAFWELIRKYGIDAQGFRPNQT